MTTNPNTGGLPPGVPPPQVVPEGIVQPQPVPATVQIEVVPGEPIDLVQLRIFSPTGVQIVFLAPDQAQAIGEGMVKAGKQASTGIIIANGKLHP